MMAKTWKREGEGEGADHALASRVVCLRVGVRVGFRVGVRTRVMGRAD